MNPKTYLIVAASMLPAMLAGLAAGCGDVVVIQPGSTTTTGAGGYIFIDAGTGGHKPDADAAQDAFEEYIDPGCPDAQPPIEDFQCDPYKQGNGDCPPGEACYIFVEYPNEPCAQEIYGAFCYPAGTGPQGAPCSGGLDCAAGHVCVITGSGNQCVQLCNLVGPDGCPPGFVCEPIDVKGFGGCL